MSEPSLSPTDAERVAAIQRSAERGAEGVPALVAQLREPSWAVRRAVVGALAGLGDAAIEALATTLRTRRDSETEIAAIVDALSSSIASHERLEHAVSELARDPDPAVVCDAAQIFGRRRARTAAPLLSALTAHTDDNVAVAAIEALGRIGGDAGIETLVRLASGDNFFRTFPAIDALGRSSDPRAVGVLTALLAQPLYATEAARALGRTGDLRAVPPLAHLFAAAHGAGVRVAAAALDDLYVRRAERIGDDREVALLVRKEAPRTASAHLVRAAVDADVAETRAIARVLGWTGGDDALAFLLRQLDGEKPLVDASVAALRELGGGIATRLEDALRSGDSARRAALLPLFSEGTGDVTPYLSDPDPSVRAAACDALARAGRTHAVPHLFARLTDPDRRVAHVALGAIQSLGSAETERLTLEGLASADAALRRASFRLLGYFGYAAGLDAAVRALADVDPQIRDAAAAALAFIESPRAIDALLAACAGEPPALRAAAARALGQLTARPDVLEALRRALSDSDAWVRYYAVQALGKLRDEEAVPRLVPLIEDPAGQVRVAAVESLARSRGDLASVALAHSLESADADIQRAALVGLGQSGRQTAVPRLVAATASRDAATRLVALSSLAAFEGDHIVAALRDASLDADESVRSAALELLGTRSGAAATRALAELLSEPSLHARVTRFLGTEVEGRVDGLLFALSGADEERARSLAMSLARLHHARARTALVHVLMTAEPPASRCAAAEALALLGLATSRDALAAAAQEDPEPRVRRLCARLLES